MKNDKTVKRAKGRKAWLTESDFVKTVDACRVPGKLVREGTNKYVFTADAGEILNWWSTTKSYNFQGDPDERILERRFTKALDEKYARSQLFPS